MNRQFVMAALGVAIGASAAHGQERLRKIATITGRLGTIDVTSSSDGYMPVQLFGSDNIGVRSSLVSMTHDEALRWASVADSVLAIAAHPAPGEELKYDNFESTLSFTRHVTPAEDVTVLGFSKGGFVEFSTILPRITMLRLVASIRKAATVADGMRGGKAYPNPNPASAVVESTFSSPPATSAITYLPYEVERPAIVARDAVMPQYPDALRSAGIEGTVDVEFVVDTAGRVDSSTVEIRRATNDIFAAAVRAAAPRMRYLPAQIGGHPVRQLVMTTFPFALSH